MSVPSELRASVREIGFALRRPEQFAVRWRDRTLGDAPSPLVFPVLLANAAVGLAVYGLTMRLPEGAGPMIAAAVQAPLAAGLAWTLALPALYVVNSALGSRLDLSTTVLAASTTVSFGALAMLASVPIAWFFSLALPYPFVRTAVHGVIFAGVGVCMADTFLRTMRALEPERGWFYPLVWLGLVGVLGAELMVLLGLLPF